MVALKRVHVILMDGKILTSKLEYTRKLVKNTSTMWSLVVKFIPFLFLPFAFSKKLPSSL